MGYHADTVDVDFVVPAANTAAAFAAVTGNSGTESTYTDGWGDQHSESADKLVAVLRDLTSFESEVTDDGDFELSGHCDKWLDETETVLAALAPYAVEGSYVRLAGEDNTQFGYRVVSGKLKQEYGVTKWKLKGKS
jgi:hypothetical protein